MYSLVLLAATAAGPEVPANLLCPVTPSNYGSAFWSKYSFFDCCAPARYGWVTCWTKGFGAYPGNARGFCGGCGPSFGPFYRQSPCACGPCGGVGYGGHGGCGPAGCGFCGYGWPVANCPAYYTSVLGCPPFMSGPPYAYYTNCRPCCNLNFAFDTGLIGHSHGVGYAGFGGTGNFGFYGAVPMAHRPSVFDLPPFPKPEYPALGPTAPSGPVPMPALPGTGGGSATPPKVPAIPPDSLLPAPPFPRNPLDRNTEPPRKEESGKTEPKKEQPRKETPKKGKTEVGRPARATVVLSVPARATVTVEGRALKSTGSERSFRTPELEPGREFVYTVRAVINLSGREDAEIRQVRVRAGETSRASFEKLFARVEASAGHRVADGKRSK